MPKLNHRKLDRKNLKFERVDWVDTVGTSSWTDPEDLPRIVPVSNFGFVVFEDKVCVSLVASFPHDMTVVGDCCTIPKGCIVRRVKISHKALAVPDDLNVE